MKSVFDFAVGLFIYSLTVAVASPLIPSTFFSEPLVSFGLSLFPDWLTESNAISSSSSTRRLDLELGNSWGFCVDICCFYMYIYNPQIPIRYRDTTVSLTAQLYLCRIRTEYEEILHISPY